MAVRCGYAVIADESPFEGEHKRLIVLHRIDGLVVLLKVTSLCVAGSGSCN